MRTLQTDTNVLFSIVIPVLHESKDINSRIAHLYSIAGNHPIEVLVVDGAPEQETLSALHDIRVVGLSVETGRAVQMNAGARAARGEVLVFLHADTLLPACAFDAIAATLSDRRCVGGAFDLQIDSSNPVYTAIARVSSIRSRITRIPYGDQALFLRSDYFRAMGGFSEIPLMEDVDLMRRIKKRGDAIAIVPDRVVTSPRRWEKEGILYGTLRNWLLIMLYYLGISPKRLAKYYGGDLDA